MRTTTAFEPLGLPGPRLLGITITGGTALVTVAFALEDDDAEARDGSVTQSRTRRTYWALALARVVTVGEMIDEIEMD